MENDWYYAEWTLVKFSKMVWKDNKIQIPLQHIALKNNWTFKGMHNSIIGKQVQVGSTCKQTGWGQFEQDQDIHTENDKRQNSAPKCTPTGIGLLIQSCAITGYHR